MFVVFKVEHFGCINLISKHAVFEEALAQVKNSVAAKLSSASTAFQTANGYYHCNIDSISVTAHAPKNVLLASANADCNGESTDWGIFSVDDAAQFLLFKNVEYGPMSLLNAFESFDFAYSAMKEDLAKEANEAYDMDFTAEDMEDKTLSNDYSIFLSFDESSTDNGAPLATANLCENVPVIDWYVFKL